MSLQRNNMSMAGMNQPPPSIQRQGFPQGPQGPADIETVRRNYREALYELTFNSKPIITNLTIMAQENQHAAAVIVREIEQQIRHNAPGQKLPVLYLIDSICKNVGGVYIDHFGRDIASTFLDAYTVTDPNTRKSFERLLHTWKNGMPNGTPVFSRQVIESIERPLNYIRARNQAPQSSASLSPQRQPQTLHPQHASPQQQQPRFPSSPQQQQQQPQRTASPRSHHQQIHVNPNFVPKRDPRDPRSRNVYANQEHVSRPMAPQVSNPVVSPATATTTQPFSLAGGVPNDILSTLQSILPSQAMHHNDSATDQGTATSQLLSQIQSILPTLPPQQSSAIQQYLNQILGSNTNNSNNNINNNTSTQQQQQQNQMTHIGNILSGLPFSMPPVSTTTIATSTPTPIPTMAPTPPPMQSQGQAAVSNIGRLSHSPPVYRAPAPLVPAPATPSPPVAAPINTAELLKGLTSMGILNGNLGLGNSSSSSSNNNNDGSNNTPTSMSATTPSSIPTNNTTNDTTNTDTNTTTTTTEEKGGAGEPSEKTISLNDFGSFKLESKDLQIVRPGAIELLYGGLPLQCKQCGFRYPKTPEGQSKMDAHLDSHFRQNRRMKERVKRGLSRSWFVTEEEWVSGSGGELTSHQAPTFLLNDSTTADVTMGSPSASGATIDTVSPETHRVVMPNDEDRKPCPICGERFIDFWNDDEEEWMYKNAVMVDHTIYHATCHADAVKSGTLVGSNEEEDTEMTESSQGVKRKIDDEMMDRDDVKAPRIDENEQDQK